MTIEFEKKSSVSSLAALFPGQGSQFVGMGKDLYDNFSYVKQLFEEASDALRFDLKKLCFEGSESDLTLTENTQPCLLTASVAAFRVAEKELNFLPAAVAGHSLGEYSALVAAQSIPFSVAIQWVRERGLAMQKAVPAGEGTMAAILGLEDAAIERLCKTATETAKEKRNQQEAPELRVKPIVQPANFNAPGQVVIAGSIDAVQEAIQLVKAGSAGDFPGGKAIALNVSAPFHCELMYPAKERMKEVFALLDHSQKPKQPFCAYVPNRTARLTEEAGVIEELLIEQIDHPVLWKHSMLSLLDSGFSTFIEFGPGKVLCGLMKRIATNPPRKCTLHALGDTASLKAYESMLKMAS